MQEPKQAAAKVDTLVFVEVRFRKSAHWGDGADSIDHRKQQKLIRTAEHFLQRSRQFQLMDCRFDVISANNKKNDTVNYELRWIKNAFTAG